MAVVRWTVRKDRPRVQVFEHFGIVALPGALHAIRVWDARAWPLVQAVPS